MVLLSGFVIYCIAFFLSMFLGFVLIFVPFSVPAPFVSLSPFSYSYYFVHSYSIGHRIGFHSPLRIYRS